MPTYIKETCGYCEKTFYNTLKLHTQGMRTSVNKILFCSTTCSNKIRTRKGKTDVLCINCNDSFSKHNSQILKTKNNFCSKSCAATYNNKNKSHGTRRSKLEIYIEEKLKSEFPSISFLSNDKTIIKSELDFYFPNLKLAIEINGPLHYDPIYGKTKLLQIQNNDSFKVAVCKEANIKLVTIGNLKNCTESYANERWIIIKKILEGAGELESPTSNVKGCCSTN